MRCEWYVKSPRMGRLMDHTHDARLDSVEVPKGCHPRNLVHVSESESVSVRAATSLVVWFLRR